MDVSKPCSETELLVTALAASETLASDLDSARAYPTSSSTYALGYLNLEIARERLQGRGLLRVSETASPRESRRQSRQGCLG